MSSACCSFCHSPCYPEGLHSLKNIAVVGANCTMNGQGRHYVETDPTKPVCDNSYDFLSSHKTSRIFFRCSNTRSRNLKNRTLCYCSCKLPMSSAIQNVLFSNPCLDTQPTRSDQVTVTFRLFV